MIQNIDNHKVNIQLSYNYMYRKEILIFQVIFWIFLVLNPPFQLSIQTELVVPTKTIKSHLKTNITDVKFLHIRTWLFYLESLILMDFGP